jgi:integrase
MRKPYFWKARQAWYVRVGRSQVRLSEDEGEAYKLWQAMVESSQINSARMTLRTLAEKFLVYAAENFTPETLNRYGRYIASFANEHGAEMARNIRPIQITEWLADHPGWKSSSTRGDAIEAIKRIYSFGVEQGIFQVSPVQTLKRPEKARRSQLVTDGMHMLMVMQCRRANRKSKKLQADGSPAPGTYQHGRAAAFRPFLIALKHCGARPQTIRAVRAEDVANGGKTWLLERHKTSKKTGKPLVVFLDPCMQTLTKILLHARRHEGGELFRNERGRPWSKDATVQRMARLREKIGLPAGTVSYSFRHGFATNSLQKGMDSTTVGLLMGHADPSMVARTYSHLEQKQGYLLDAAALASRRDAG